MHSNGFPIRICPTNLVRLLTACALAISLFAQAEAQADKLADILSKGVVRIVVFGDVPPFGSTNVNRELEGFDIDMAKLVAQALGVKLELVQATAANRIPYLLTDKADLNISPTARPHSSSLES